MTTQPKARIPAVDPPRASTTVVGGRSHRRGQAAPFCTISSFTKCCLATMGFHLGFGAAPALRPKWPEHGFDPRSPPARPYKPGNYKPENVLSTRNLLFASSSPCSNSMALLKASAKADRFVQTAHSKPFLSKASSLPCQGHCSNPLSNASIMSSPSPSRS
jgi:hypothetical protein